MARGRDLLGRDVYRVVAAAPSQTALPTASTLRDGSFAASCVASKFFASIEDTSLAVPCAAGRHAAPRLRPLTLSPVANSGRLFFQTLSLSYSLTAVYM